MPWARPDFDDEESIRLFKERSKALSAMIKADPERYECTACALGDSPVGTEATGSPRGEPSLSFSSAHTIYITGGCVARQLSFLGRQKGQADMPQTIATRPQRARQAPKRYEPEEMPMDDWTDGSWTQGSSDSDTEDDEDGSSSLDSFVVDDDEEDGGDEPSECSEVSEAEWSDTEDMEED